MRLRLKIAIDYRPVLHVRKTFNLSIASNVRSPAILPFGALPIMLLLAARFTKLLVAKSGEQPFGATQAFADTED
jgi:hypothetical protein